MRIVTLLLCTLALALAPGAAGTGVADELAPLRAHLEFLADDRLEGRDTGSRGYDLAALYAATRLREYGLEPGAGGGFEQPVTFVTARLAEVTLRVRSVAGTVELERTADFLPSPSVVHPKVSERAGVVFAGYGIDAPELGHRDFEGLDVRGRFVLELSGAPASFPADQRAHHSSRRQKAAEAARRGALGVLVVRTRVDEQRQPWQRMTLNAGRHPALRWRHPDGAVQDAFPELRFTAVLSAAGARKLLAGSGLDYDALLAEAEDGTVRPRVLPLTVAVTARSEIGQAASANVVARLPGGDPALAGEHVVLTAHLDHVGVGAAVDGDDIYNGFYDNAMGSAIVLDLARRLAAAPAPPRRSILFVLVTGEEKGLLGSDYFAHYPTVPVDSIVANVNVDMPLLRAPLADLVAFGAEHSTLAPLAEAAARAQGFTLSPDPAPAEVIFVRSDQYSFVRQGIPAVFLGAGVGTAGGGTAQATAVAEFLAEHYHRPSDEAELGADWDAVARFTAVNAALARAIADAPERPRWNPGDFFGTTFAGGR